MEDHNIVYEKNQMEEVFDIFKRVAPNILKIPKWKLEKYFVQAIVLSVKKNKILKCLKYLTTGYSKAILHSYLGAASDLSKAVANKNVEYASESTQKADQSSEGSFVMEILKSIEQKPGKHDYDYILKCFEFAQSVYRFIIEEFPPEGRQDYAKYYICDTSQCGHDQIKMLCEDCAKERIDTHGISSTNSTKNDPKQKKCAHKPKKNQTKALEQLS